MDLFETLNPMQKEAVLATEGPLLLLAGAGSGKTKTLTHRIAYLVEQGIPPTRILAITFTNKAAREMKERISSLIENSERMWVGTFHATCVRILRRDIDLIGYDKSFAIYDYADSEKLMKETLLELNISGTVLTPRFVLSAIGRKKDSLITPEICLELAADNYNEKQIATAYKSYQRKLKKANALDFDDIIFKTVELLREHPDILNSYSDRFLYVMVDEYQDTNTAQYELVRLLSSKYNNLCVVGDDDQSIYGWRGANIENIRNFEKDFRNSQVIKLEQNYRSTKTILNAANAVICNNNGRTGKTLWTENPEGEKIHLHRADTDIMEAEFVKDQILTAAKSGAAYKDFAVLYRMNAQSRLIEEAFFKNGLPYRIVGGIRFYERKEIKDVLAYLSLINNPANDLAAKRIINVPKRGIGTTSVQKISEYSDKNNISFFEALKFSKEIMGGRAGAALRFVSFIEEISEQVLPVSEIILKVIHDSGLIEEIKSEKNSDNNSEERIKNIEELVSKAVEFEKQHEDATLAEFLEEIALVADIDNYNENDDATVLMTVHSAKGLEFKTVFIIGFEDNIFPAARALNAEDDEQLEEERRLCYVAITRAREKLFITNAVTRMTYGDDTVSNNPSLFLKEIPPELTLSVGGKKKSHTHSPNQISTRESRQNVEKIFSKKPEVFNFKPPVSKKTGQYYIGDKVFHKKYGEGIIKQLRETSTDTEIMIYFNNETFTGEKKFLSNTVKLEKRRL